MADNTDHHPIVAGGCPPVCIATRYGSRFGLLGAMATELAHAARDAGLTVYTEDGGAVPAGGPAVRVFFNHPASVAALRAWAGPSAGEGSDELVQVFVDHPLALDPAITDALAGLANFRMLLVSGDDSSLLRLRWPRLSFATCAQGVPASALADVTAGGRDIDVVVAGGIHAESELAALWAGVPAALRECGHEIVELMDREGASFVAASEASLPGFVRASDPWRMLQLLHRACVATVNRRRRVAAVGALRGVRRGDGRPALVAVAGPPAWREHCGENVGYAGEVAYASLPTLFARSRVCVAWGPTQFATAYSERLLLGMAAGCACVTEDRLMVRAHMGDGVARFAEGSPAALREAVGGLLGDADRCDALGRWGHGEVAANHLWRHRLPLVLGVDRVERDPARRSAAA